MKGLADEPTADAAPARFGGETNKVQDDEVSAKGFIKCGWIEIDDEAANFFAMFDNENNAGESGAAFFNPSFEQEIRLGALEVGVVVEMVYAMRSGGDFFDRGEIPWLEFPNAHSSGSRWGGEKRDFRQGSRHLDRAVHEVKSPGLEEAEQGVFRAVDARAN